MPPTTLDEMRAQYARAPEKQKERHQREFSNAKAELDQRRAERTGKGDIVKAAAASLRAIKPPISPADLAIALDAVEGMTETIKKDILGSIGQAADRIATERLTPTKCARCGSTKCKCKLADLTCHACGHRRAHHKMKNPKWKKCAAGCTCPNFRRHP